MAGTMLGELLIGSMSTDAPFGPCRWPADYTCSTIPAGAESIKDLMEDAATELIWALSGRQFGECGVTIRPCRQTCNDGSLHQMASYPFPARVDNVWMNLACGSCEGDCACGPVERISLPGPVTRVTQVVIDGAALLSSAWRVDDRLTLVRQDGGHWPTCQDLSKPAGAVGTWSVFGFYGREVPTLGQLSKAEITCEFVKSCTGDKTCQLPNNWTSITRGGVSITRPNAVVKAKAQDLDVIPEEWLPFTRRFLRAYNPYGAQAPSSVWSPDIPRPTRTF